VLPCRSWGGAREGAGRKPKGDRAGVSHRTRAALAARFPVHVTIRRKKNLPLLRQSAEYQALRAAFTAGKDRFGFRLIHYSIQRDHLHFVVEARDRKALSRGLQGLLIRCAKALNRLWKRSGSVWADRYHDRILHTPREVRATLLYVLANAKHHGIRLREALDVFTSAWCFDGWRESFTVENAPPAIPVAPAHTWLLTRGWRKRGLLSLYESPG
jgi:REP element-mobilizing transposase RayT